MKNEYDYLNGAELDLSGYEPAELTKEERIIMKKEVLNKTKKRSRAKRVIAVAAAVAVVFGVTQLAFAGGIVERIVKTISTGHNTIIETDNSGVMFALPEELSGRVFDKDGKPVTELEGGLNESDIELYDENGVKYDEQRWIDLMYETGVIDKDKMRVSVSAASEGKLIPDENENNKVYTTLDELKRFKSGLNFDLLEPEYLPEGYSFLYAAGFANDGVVSGDYAVIGYSNGTDVFTVHERIINDKTKYTTSYDAPVSECEIHGCAAAVTNSSAEWEQGGVSVAVLSGNSGVIGDELLKVAESVK